MQRRRLVPDVDNAQDPGRAIADHFEGQDTAPRDHLVP